MFERKWGKQPSRQQLRTLLHFAEAHRVELLQEWQEKVQIDQ